jgi:hypothetical protein
VSDNVLSVQPEHKGHFALLRPMNSMRNDHKEFLPSIYRIAKVTTLRGSERWTSVQLSRKLPHIGKVTLNGE